MNIGLTNFRGLELQITKKAPEGKIARVADLAKFFLGVGNPIGDGRLYLGGLLEVVEILGYNTDVTSFPKVNGNEVDESRIVGDGFVIYPLNSVVYFQSECNPNYENIFNKLNERGYNVVLLNESELGRVVKTGK